MRALVRRNWPALLMLGLFTTRLLQGAKPWSAEVVCLGIAMLGLLMNVAVTIANGGMPVAASDEQISDDQRDLYHSINDRTRLRFLADWIDVGWAFYSPGDIVIDIGVFSLIAVTLCRAIW